MGSDDDDDDDARSFRDLPVDECIELGYKLETPWDAIGTLAEEALQTGTP